MYSKKRKCKYKTCSRKTCSRKTCSRKSCSRKSCSRKTCSRKSCKGGTVETVDVKLYHSPYNYKYLNKKWVLKNDALFTDKNPKKFLHQLKLQNKQTSTPIKDSMKNTDELIAMLMRQQETYVLNDPTNKQKINVITK